MKLCDDFLNSVLSCLICQQKHAAALYAQAADFNKTARFYYMKAQDAYYLANAQVLYCNKLISAKDPN